MGWLVKGKGTAADVFVPFAFEVGGALGSEAEAFLRECTGVQHGKAAELSTACAARGRGAPRGGGAWLAARVQTGEKRGRNGGLSTP